MAEEKNKTDEEKIEVLTCPMCKKVTESKDWNSYYHACDACVAGAGRIGT